MNLIQYQETIDANVIGKIKKNFIEKYNYLISSDILLKDPQTIKVIIIPEENYSISDIRDTSRNYEWQYKRQLKVIWYYKYGKIKEFVKEEYCIFTFWAYGYINLTENYFADEVVDDYKITIETIEKMKLSIGSKYGLKDLLNLKTNYFNPNVISKFTEISRQKVKYSEYQDALFCIDLENKSIDLRNIIAEMLIYRNYLYDNSSARYHNGKKIHTYFPTFYDKNYYLLASLFLQIFSSFWDKIAFLFDVFFPINMAKEGIYFSKMIDKFPVELRDDNFEQIVIFKQNYFHKANKLRNEVVHKCSLDNKVYGMYLDNFKEEIKIKELQDWKVNLTNEFILLHDKSLECFEDTMKFIESNAINKVQTNDSI